MTQPREWWQDDSHPDAKAHRKFLEKSAKEDAERALAIVPVHKALPPPRRKSALTSGDFESIGRAVGGTVMPIIKKLEKRIKDLEARPFKFIGVWSQGMDCIPGNIVSWGGSMWHCNEPTKAKPGTGPEFTLCCKRGRDGRPGGQK